MHILKTSFNEDPNIGLRIFSNDKFCIVPISTSEKLCKNFEEVLKVPIIKTNIAGTTLVGAFICGNNSKIILPDILFDKEIEILKENNINFEILDTKLTALGNNIVMNDHGVVINPDYSKEDEEKIGKIFGLPVKKWKINDLEIVGSLVKLNDKGCITNHDIADFEINFLEKFLKTKITTGTVNFGSPNIASGLVCNKNGFIIGGLSSGTEIVNIDEGLGFIDND